MRHQRHGLKRWLPQSKRGWGLTIAGLLIVLVMVAWGLSRRTPSWYQPLDGSEMAAIDAAEGFQRKVTFELHNTLERVPLGEQRWMITQEEINSWLAVRFGESDAGGAGAGAGGAATRANGAKVSQPMVVFSPGKVTVAVRTTLAPGGGDGRGNSGGVVSLVFRVKTQEGADGKAEGMIEVDGAWLGSLPVPKFLVQRKIQAAIPTVMPVLERALAVQLGTKRADGLMPDVRGTTAAVMRGEPFPLQFTFDRRKVVMREITVEEGKLMIVFVPPIPAAVRPR